MCGPDERRPSQRDRLDQILSAERKQAAADENDVGGRAVARHLAHRVTEHDVDVVRNRCVVAAAHERNAALAQERRDFREPLRVAGNDDGECRGRQSARGDRVQDQRLLAFARRGGEPDGPRLAEAKPELATERNGGVGDVDVELEVADHGGARRAQRGDARGVCLALRRNAGERRHHRAR